MYMLGCRPCSSLIDRNHQICAQSGDSVDRETYQRLVGRLIYLCHISCAVSVVSRYMHNPKTGHMEVVYRILRYLKGTPGKGLWFRKNKHLDLEEYCDADWAVARMIEDQHLDIVYLWVVILSHGGARNKRWWLGLLQRPSIEQ